MAIKYNSLQQTHSPAGENVGAVAKHWNKQGREKQMREEGEERKCEIDIKMGTTVGI